MLNLLRRFMIGRYGGDSLNRFLLGVNFAFLFVWLFTRFRPIAWVILILMAVCYYRMLSRDITRRYKENQRFLQWWGPVQANIADAVSRFRDRKQHCYYKCPACKTRLRVPRGRGKINIKCPKCGSEFVKKS